MDMREADRRALRQMFGPMPQENDSRTARASQKCVVVFQRTLLLEAAFEGTPEEAEAWAEEQMSTLRAANYADAVVRYTIEPADGDGQWAFEERRQELVSTYTMTVNLDGSEDEIPFVGLPELAALLESAQRARRENEVEPLGVLQVSIWQDVPPPDHYKRLWVCYNVHGSDLGGIRERSEEEEEVNHLLAILGLPQ